jgi:hypothetical protein
VCTSKVPHFFLFLMQKMPLLWLQDSWITLFSEMSLG